MYPQLSMYAPCVLHALRYFERDQFLFLKYEDLMRMDAASIVRLIGRFTGGRRRGGEGRGGGATSQVRGEGQGGVTGAGDALRARWWWRGWCFRGMGWL